MKDDAIKVDILFGSVAIDSRWREEGGRLYGQGRKRVFDRDGRLVETTPWEDTGCSIGFDAQNESREGLLSWWRRRKDAKELRELAAVSGDKVVRDKALTGDLSRVFVKVKVDGSRAKVSVDALVRAYQKNRAADNRLREATHKLRAVK